MKRIQLTLFLAADLASGHFTEIETRYCNDRGDYLFLVFEKPKSH